MSKIGFAYFFQRGLKRFDQRVRKFAQKSDGVGEEHALLVRQSEAARRRIERGEESVFRHDVRARQQIQQCRFPSIGVADNGRDRPLMTLPSLALNVADFAHAFELALQTRDPFLHAPPIDFQLRFAGTARADAARLPRKVRPHSR